MRPPSLLPAHLEPSAGGPSPLGATPGAEGVNFAVYSRHAAAMTLSLFEPGGRPWREIALDPDRHRTDDVWHVFLPGARAGAEYGWRAEGPRGPQHAFDPQCLLLDPYGRGVAGAERWGARERHGRNLRSVVVDPVFDWEDDRAPRTALADSVVYETHVRAFTRHSSSGVAHPGTFAGLIQKIPHLVSLGVTAVQLMPVAEFDETANPRSHPETREPLLDVWGYSPLSFFAPKLAYAADATPHGAVNEFRRLVQAMHRAGIEVILDVVFNHTGEGGPLGPARSWRGLDRASYYLVDDRGRDLDVTGCGHTFACARPASARLIVDALRWWAVDMRVDGFRFDLASVLARGEDGRPLEDPPLLRALSADPALAGVKLIAEPWDAGGLYHVGRFPHAGRWAELNGRFRDDVRRFLRGAPATVGNLATRLAGSSDLYAEGRRPGHSVNFVTSHDGFTLADLVSHERKHNLANGEANRDGFDGNDSWNCGIEGPTDEPHVVALRAKQVRNFASLLLFAQGATLWLWGDELLRTQHGNNNAWCQDGPAWWLDWSRVSSEHEFLRFVRGLVRLRRSHAAFRRDAFFAERRSGQGAVAWHGHRLDAPAWDERSRHVSMHFVGGVAEPDFLLIVNGAADPASFELPLPDGARLWRRLVDTALPPPADLTLEQDAPALADASAYVAGSLSVVLLTAR